MVRVQYLIVVNGDWKENGEIVAMEEVPNVGAIEYIDGTLYQVVGVNQDDNGLYDVFLD